MVHGLEKHIPGSQLLGDYSTRSIAEWWAQ